MTFLIDIMGELLFAICRVAPAASDLGRITSLHPVHSCHRRCSEKHSRGQ